MPKAALLNTTVAAPEQPQAEAEMRLAIAMLRDAAENRRSISPGVALALAEVLQIRADRHGVGDVDADDDGWMTTGHLAAYLGITTDQVRHAITARVKGRTWQGLDMSMLQVRRDPVGAGSGLRYLIRKSSVPLDAIRAILPLRYAEPLETGDGATPSGDEGSGVATPAGGVR